MVAGTFLGFCKSMDFAPTLQVEKCGGSGNINDFKHYHIVVLLLKLMTDMNFINDLQEKCGFFFADLTIFPKFATIIGRRLYVATGRNYLTLILHPLRDIVSTALSHHEKPSSPLPHTLPHPIVRMSVCHDSACGRGHSSHASHKDHTEPTG